MHNTCNASAKSLFQDAETFKGFRFAEMHDDDEDELEQHKHQMISLNTDHIMFGHGRHAW